MRSLRVLIQIPADHFPIPDTLKGLSDAEMLRIKTDYDVACTLAEIGHQVDVIGVSDDLTAIRDRVRRVRPHVVFNLLEEFAARGENVAYVLGYLELIGQAYTGCNPVGMLLSTDKAMQRKILRYHRIRVPEFAIFRRGHTVRRPKRLSYPLIVKSLSLHGSVGISQASVVHNDDKLIERVRFMHEHIGDDAIVERFIEGRELYVGMLGNQRLETFPIWELHVRNLRDGAPMIATDRIKWDAKYQKTSGVTTAAATDLEPATVRRITAMCRRAYRALHQSGYCRMDLRLDAEGQAWLIESNPNPQLSFGEDFAEAAEAAQIPYPRLLQRILNLGMRYRESREHS